MRSSSRLFLKKVFFTPLARGLSSPFAGLLYQRVVLFLYFLELLFNRTLMRTLVFIPPSPVRSIMEALTSYLGLFALNATVVLPLAGLLVTYTGLGIVFLLFVGLDLLGFFKVKYLLIPLAAAMTYYSPRWLPASLLVVVIVLASTFTHLYLGWIATLVWALYPIALMVRDGLRIDRWSYVAVGIAALLFVGTYYSPYHVAQVFILAMGVVNPWLLPVAVVTYGLAPRNPLNTILLLTGPTVQLSGQVFLIAYYMARVLAPHADERPVGPVSARGGVD